MRTIENCRIIKDGVKKGLGYPAVIDGKCEGYCTESSDEPCEACKRCKLHTAYESTSKCGKCSQVTADAIAKLTAERDEYKQEAERYSRAVDRYLNAYDCPKCGEIVIKGYVCAGCGYGGGSCSDD